MRAFGHQYTEFALPVFSDAEMSRWRLLPFRPSVVMPLGLVAPDGRTILLAPLHGVPRAGDRGARRPRAGRRGLRAGWHGDIDDVDAGFATELAIIAGDGARDCFSRWARLLRARSGVSGAGARRRRARHAPLVLDRQRERVLVPHRRRPRRGVDGRRRGRRSRGARHARRPRCSSIRGGIRTRCCARSTPTSGRFRRPGMVRWEPRADVLPDGVQALRERLGRRPLVAHCRHLSSKSPYVDDFAMWIDGDRAHPQHDDFYERLLDQAVAWGVEVFEHDWLIECFLGVRGSARAGRAAAWQEGIDAGLESTRPARAVVHGVAGRLRAGEPASQCDLDPHQRRPRVPRGTGAVVGLVPAHQRHGARSGFVAVQGRVPLRARVRDP